VSPLAGGLSLLLALPAVFDHSAFDALLRAHVERGLVDYDAFQAAPGFPRYLDQLAGADPAALPERERLAFWINAYNAYTIHLINTHRERASIRNINTTLGLKLPGPWKKEIVRAGGRTYHLDHVEHEIIRKQFREPRIHFALVCAAQGCPPLRTEAYAGARLEAQLDDQARAFLLRSPAHNRVDLATRTVYLSPLFDWDQDDFGGCKAAVGRYVAAFLPAGPARDLLLSGDFALKHTDYDWSLNLLRRGP
jgi:hypothetical protein